MFNQVLLNESISKKGNLVTINMCGGLGNQLFQVAILISYGLKNKIPFFFSR